MSMVRTFADRGDPRPCYLFFGSKHLDDATYHEEIARYAAELPLTVIHVASDPPNDWNGKRGYVEKLRRLLPSNCVGLQYFICGPGAMQDAMEDALAELGVPGDRVHTERFNFV